MHGRLHHPPHTWCDGLALEGRGLVVRMGEYLPPVIQLFNYHVLERGMGAGRQVRKNSGSAKSTIASERVFIGQKCEAQRIFLKSSNRRKPRALGICQQLGMQTSVECTVHIYTVQLFCEGCLGFFSTGQFLFNLIPTDVGIYGPHFILGLCMLSVITIWVDGCAPILHHTVIKSMN